MYKMSWRKHAVEGNGSLVELQNTLKPSAWTWRPRRCTRGTPADTAATGLLRGDLPDEEEDEEVDTSTSADARARAGRESFSRAPHSFSKTKKMDTLAPVLCVDHAGKTLLQRAAELSRTLSAETALA